MPEFKRRGYDLSGTQLAVNLFDLDRVESMVRELLLGGKLDLSRAVITDPDRLDEGAVVFACDLLTAACCCDVLRDHDRKAGVHPTRVYVKKRASWAKLSGTAMLTETVSGVIRLNPAWFAADTEDVPPPITGPITIGRTA